MTPNSPSGAETCFGCDRKINPGEPRIHIGLDEWGQANGQPPIGLGDDDIRLPFCEPCTVPTERKGWQFEYEALDDP